MKRINSLRDLESFGIRSLTGEADRLGYRMLCDLTLEGVSIVAETYGLKADAFQPNWNSGAIASCLLSYGAWRDIAPIALAGYHTVFRTKNTFFGLEGNESIEQAQWEYNEQTGEVKQTAPAMLTVDGETTVWPSWYGKIERYYQTGETRNTHAMTGRTV